MSNYLFIGYSQGLNKSMTLKKEYNNHKNTKSLPCDIKKKITDIYYFQNYSNAINLHYKLIIIINNSKQSNS